MAAHNPHLILLFVY